MDGDDETGRPQHTESVADRPFVERLLVGDPDIHGTHPDDVGTAGPRTLDLTFSREREQLLEYRKFAFGVLREEEERVTAVYRERVFCFCRRLWRVFFLCLES